MLTALLALPPTGLSPLSRYTVANGLLYALIGATLLLAPTLPELWGVPPIEPTQTGLVRLIGFLLGIVGWFYVFGGRTGATSFGLSTVVDRLVLVPVVLVALAASGEVPWAMVAPFLVLDPLLAIGAYAIYARASRTA